MGKWEYELKFGFIGAGNMAAAMIKGIINSGILKPAQIYAYDLIKEKTDVLKNTYQIQVASSREDLVSGCNFLVMAIKPQQFEEELTALRGLVAPSTCLVSIAAGISISYIQKMLAMAVPCVRVMPNTPLLTGQGATALCSSLPNDHEDFLLIRRIFAACGTVEIIKEDEMNAIVAVNGSSPAYVYLFAKAMVEQAEKQGIPEKTALSLVVQTLIGSACMLRDSGYTAEELIQMVSSPGGTTLQALEVLYDAQFEKIIADAMIACTKRARELEN